MVVVATKVNIRLSDEVRSQTLAEKVRRIDFLGSLTLVGSVGCLLLGISLKTTEELPWTSSSVLGLLSACAVFTAAFILVEKYWAPYPVMPLRLISQRTPLAVSLANLFASMSAFSMVCPLLAAVFNDGSDLHPTALQRTLGKLNSDDGLPPEADKVSKVFLIRQDGKYRQIWYVTSNFSN